MYLCPILINSDCSRLFDVGTFNFFFMEIIKNLIGFTIPKTPCNWISAAIGAAASHINTAYSAEMDSRNTRDTNRTNYEIAELNNQTQIQLWREQQAYDKEMWNLQNEYNSPAAQRARYTAAGLNALNMMDSHGDSGNNSSSAGGQTPPELETPTMLKSNEGAILASQSPILAQLGVNLATENKLNAEASGQHIKNSVDSASANDLISSYHSKGLLDDAHAKVAQETINTDIEFQNQKLKNSRQEYELLQFQTKNAEWTAAKTRYDVLNLQPQQAALNEQMLLNMSQELKNMFLSGELTKANIQKVMAEKASLLANIQIGWYNAQSQRIQANASQQQADNGTLLSTAQSRLLNAQSNEQEVKNGFVKQMYQTNLQVLGLNVKNMIQQVKLTEKKNDSYWFDKGFGYLESLSRSFYNVAGGISSFIPMTSTSAASGTPAAIDNGFIQNNSGFGANGYNPYNGNY